MRDARCIPSLLPKPTFFTNLWCLLANGTGYDEYEDRYTCEMNPDEDNMVRFLSGHTKECPYFRDGDEYKITRKQ